VSPNAYSDDALEGAPKRRVGVTSQIGQTLADTALVR
jgi:hypothetical protein